MSSKRTARIGKKNKWPPVGQTAQQVRPALECLEERTVPSTLFPTDQAFLIGAVQGDYQIASFGLVAAEKGTTPLQREYGAMLFTTFNDALLSTLPLLVANGVPIPSPSPSGTAEFFYLEGLPSATFNQVFAPFVIQAQQQEINLALIEMSNGFNLALKEDAAGLLAFLNEEVGISTLVLGQQNVFV
jgi:hypothetical protein